MIKLIDLLKETTGQKFEYGCTMLYFTFPEINKIHDAIDPDHIYTEEGDRSFGLEDEPHTTLLFGSHSEVTTEDIKKVLDNYIYSPCKIYNASLFENPKYDVLKFDVKGDSLHETNEDLKQYPYTSDFPNYHPHLTIGYLKPGTGKKYTKMLKGIEFELIPNYAVYSKPNGEKDKIEIKIKE
jgi:2'-5' RNA ligase